MHMVNGLSSFLSSERLLLDCAQDKVNISVAIIPMAKAFGWSPTVAGLVQSSFFWGYIVSQIPGGYVNSRFGGRTVLPIGVGLWSGATAAVPVLAGTIPGACLCGPLNACALTDCFPYHLCYAH